MHSRILLLFLLLLLFFNCSTAPKPVPDGTSPEVLLQMAQESVIKGNKYNHAIFYYREFISRFPEETNGIIEAQYEIAFILYKQKEYDASKEIFEEIITKYQGPNGELLPRWPLALTNKILPDIKAKIAERDQKRKLKKKAEPAPEEKENTENTE